MDTKELIDEAVSLPVEDRARIVDSLLQSLNQIQSGIDNAWLQIAQQRLAEIRQGKTGVADGKAVFDNIWKRFGE